VRWIDVGRSRLVGRAYDSPVAWYLWVIVVAIVLALILLGAILFQRRRRAGGVLSVRPRTKRPRR